MDDLKTLIFVKQQETLAKSCVQFLPKLILFLIPFRVPPIVINLVYYGLVL